MVYPRQSEGIVISKLSPRSGGEGGPRAGRENCGADASVGTKEIESRGKGRYTRVLASWAKDGGPAAALLHAKREKQRRRRLQIPLQKIIDIDKGGTPTSGKGLD